MKPQRRAPKAAPEGSTALLARTSLGLMRGWSLGTGPVVLMVHGWEGESAQWAPLARELAARGLCAIAFDLPAHGSSEGESASAVSFAQAVLEIAAPLGRLHGLAAHSLGGAASCLAIADGLDVDKVLLLAPVAEPTHFANALGRALGLSEEALPMLHTEIEARVGRTFASLQAPLRVRGLDHDVLVIHDPADREVPFAHGTAIAGAFRRGRLVPVNGVGHRRILASPAIIEAGADFLAPRVS